MSADCTSISAETIGSVVTCIQSTVAQQLISRQEVLIPEGQDLAAAFLLITLSLIMLDALLSGDGAQAIGDAIHSLMRYFVVVVMLAGWSTTVGDFFNGNMNQIAQKLSGVDSVGTSVNLIFKAMVAMVAPEEAAAGEDCVTTAPGEYDAVPGQVYCFNPPGVKGESPSFFSIFTILPKIIFKILIKALSFALLLVMLAVYVLIIVLAQAMFSIGMCVGPILVAGLVWKRAEFLFDGWLKFMLHAAMTKIVAALMIAAVTGVIVVLSNLSKLIEGGGGLSRIDVIAAAMVAVVAAVGGFLMLQVQSISSALLSGGSGVSPKGFGKGPVGSSINKALTGKSQSPQPPKNTPEKSQTNTDIAL
jgi:hypothetical protein